MSQKLTLTLQRNKMTATTKIFGDESMDFLVYGFLRLILQCSLLMKESVKSIIYFLIGLLSQEGLNKG